MDAEAGRGSALVKQALALIAIVAALRLPFLHQAIQGDDLYYLYGAEHAQIEPLHPDHAKYLFQGDLVEMRGHSHPPLNSWILGALLWALGDVREVPYHLAYSIFSIIAALAMLSLARRFSTKPFLAALLFVAVPAFVVNGNSLESDLPFLAFWMLAIALFVKGTPAAFIGSAIAAGIASLGAYQSIFIVPILGSYLWMKRSRNVFAWCVIFAGPATLLAWNIFSRITSGAMPAAVLASYMQSYGWEAFAQKVKNTGALIVHSAWIISPILVRGNRWNWILGAVTAAGGAVFDPNPIFWASLGLGVVLLASYLKRGWLEAWILIFFACALIVFFAGSARYLLPMAAPVAILAANRCGERVLILGFVSQLLLSIGFAVVNYQVWGGYRTFAESLAPEAAQTRVWVDKDWGLRYYLESEGALAIPRGQTFATGDIVVSSTAPPQGQLISSVEIRPSIPLRLFSINGKSAYSLAARGLRPFDISSEPVDRVGAYLIGARKAELTWVRPSDQSQVLRGLYPDGWSGAVATFLVKRGSGPLRVEFTIHPQSMARTVRLTVDGQVIAEKTFAGPGSYTLEGQAPGDSPQVTAGVEVDKTFSVPGDSRELGILIGGIGFK